MIVASLFVNLPSLLLYIPTLTSYTPHFISLSNINCILNSWICISPIFLQILSLHLTFLKLIGFGFKQIKYASIGYSFNSKSIWINGQIIGSYIFALFISNLYLSWLTKLKSYLLQISFIL